MLLNFLCGFYLHIQARIFNQLEIDNYFDKKEDKEDEEKEKQPFGYTDDEEWMRNHQSKFNIRNFDIHILTVNALLGNSVESLFQARKKTEYFNRLLGYCEKTNKKLVFVFDEIHASIHNFKEEFIYRLWNYHGLVHKNYIVSATYNEASKEVIKYLSELTNNTIKIIESTRLPKKVKQSDLFLNFYIDRNIEKDETLFELVKSLLDEDKKFDILVYSKKLALVLNSKKYRIGQLFKSRGVDINKSINDPFSSDDGSIGYDKEKINIGTKFSTGISIEHIEHTFIIIFPKDLNIEFINNNGIFTMGSSSVIQALARQRKKGEIHLFMPSPINIDKDSLPTIYSEPQKNLIIDTFEKGKKYGEKTIGYSDINNQGFELNKTYKNLYKEIEPAIERIRVARRDPHLNRLIYPTKEIFIIDKGEKHLVREFFGGDLPAYILWASLTNQFLNCRLKNINFIKKIYLNTLKQYGQLEKIITDLLYDIEVIEEEYFYNWLNPYEKLNIFKEFIFNNIIILDKEKIGVSIKEKIFLDVIRVLFFNSQSISKNEVYKHYLHSCILYASDFSESYIKKYQLQWSKIEIIKAFVNWNLLKEVIEANIESYKKHTYIDKKAYKVFSDKYNEIGFKKDIELILNNDILLGTNIFSLKNSYYKEKTALKRKQYIYNQTVKTFFSNGKKQVPINKKDVSVFIYEPQRIKGLINLLFSDKETITL